jgi:hypothetical protein
MMTFEDKKSAERAYVRAQIEKPRLRELSFGRYEVTSQAGDRQYTLEYRKQAGKLVADCSCPAGRKSSSICKHSMAAYSHYKMRVNERTAAAQAAPATGSQPGRNTPVVVEEEEIVLYCACGAVWPDAYTGRCQGCEQDYRQAEEFCESRGY